MALPIIAAIYFTGQLCHPTSGYKGNCYLWESGTFRDAKHYVSQLKPACNNANGGFIGGVWAQTCLETNTTPTPSDIRKQLEQLGMLSINGDSMMRQLFNRVVSAARGEYITIDRFFHEDAVYLMNATHDLLTFKNSQKTIENISFEMRFFWDPEIKRVTDKPGWKVIAPFYWLMKPGVEVLEEFKNDINAVFVTVPEHEANPPINLNLTIRNEWIRKQRNWLPFQEMAVSNVFNRNQQDKTHYQCSFVSSIEHDISDDIKTPASGDCRDLMNYNLLLRFLKRSEAKKRTTNGMSI